MLTENGLWSPYIRWPKVFSHQLFNNQNHVVTKDVFIATMFMTTKIAPFIITCKHALGTQDGLWPKLTLGWLYSDMMQGCIYI
jgi:hypothetical protein